MYNINMIMRVYTCRMMFSKIEYGGKKMENNQKEEELLQEETVEEAEVSAEPAAEEPVKENFDDSNASAFDKFFGISKNKTTLKIEIIAGIVTFLAMCYILVVNPTNILFAYG